MKISIVMTAYNMEQYIEEAMMSCLNQTYEDIELVVVEDCSTDSTLSIIEKIANEDPRVVIVKHNVNLGAGMGRRDGINAATGEYFITVDADDWLDETFIGSLAERAKSVTSGHYGLPELTLLQSLTVFHTASSFMV
jgi:glycosyltransferase involved in cell wall biosynthesis